MNGVLLGIATFYSGIFIGQPLYCDTGIGLIYSTDTTPWVALSEDLYKAGWARCGDRIRIQGDGWTVILLALDAGPLHRYYIEDFPDQPILIDIPEHLAPFQGLSTQVKVRNLDHPKRSIQLRRR
jgi:hypothetical protein